jgi:hypothetical protein
VMAQGFKAEEAAPTLAMMPEIAPEEESTHLLRLVSEMRRTTLEGKGGGFGMDKGKSMAANLEALVGNLSSRKAGGGDLDEMIRGFTHEDIAANTLRGLVNKGPAGFAQWKGILERTSPTAIDDDIAAGRQSDAGKRMRADAQLELGEAERGVRKAPLEIALKEARAQLTKEGRFDETRAEDFIRGPLSMFGTGVNEQLVNERTLSNAYDAARVPQSKRDTLAPGARQGVADEKILAVLERQNQLIERQTKAVEATKPAPNLSAPPPGNRNGGRM